MLIGALIAVVVVLVIVVFGFGAVGLDSWADGS
jgi:hypothetical protein